MRPRQLLVLSLALLISGCGSDTEPQRTATPAQPVPEAAPPAPATPPPAPVAAPVKPVAVVPAAPPAPAQVAPPAAATTPVIFDPAAADVLAGIKPAGQTDAGLSIVGEGPQRALSFIAAAGAPWPGIAIAPATGAWNLAASAGVEAVLENVGSIPVQIGLRVDEAGGGKDAWNGEVLKLAAGATGKVRVTFGNSWGKAGYKLDAAKVGRVQIYVEKPGEGCRLLLRSLAPAGKAGEKPTSGPPKAVVIVHKPGDPQALSFAAGVDAQRVKATGATVAAVTGGAGITLAAAAAEVVFRPAQALDLRDYNQATFAVRNTGPASLRVRGRLDGAQADDRVSVEAEIPAGERREIVVPFGSGQLWQGVTPGGKPAASDKPFTGAPEERSSTGLGSDAVHALALNIHGAAGATLVWEGVVAAVAAPPALPAWLGTRPPIDGDWQQILAEEFTGDALDTTRWTPRLPWIGPIPWELQCYSDQNVSVQDGCLRIHCEKRTAHLYENPSWAVRDYATGAVTSYPNWRFRYGYAEARMKLPKALGLWPAFWTMPDRGPLPTEAAPAAGDWQGRWDAARSNQDKNRRRSTDVDGMEIDIFEHPNRFGPFRYNAACHWDGYGAAHKSTGSSKIYGQPDAEGFVVAGVLWEPGRITWYCNGAPVGTWADARVASVPMSLKFTVQMGGWAGNEVDDSALPDDFKIDWVRVWQRKAP